MMSKTKVSPVLVHFWKFPFTCHKIQLMPKLRYWFDSRNILCSNIQQLRQRLQQKSTTMSLSKPMPDYKLWGDKQEEGVYFCQTLRSGKILCFYCVASVRDGQHFATGKECKAMKAYCVVMKHLRIKASQVGVVAKPLSQAAMTMIRPEIDLILSNDGKMMSKKTDKPWTIFRNYVVGNPEDKAMDPLYTRINVALGDFMYDPLTGEAAVRAKLYQDGLYSVKDEDMFDATTAPKVAAKLVELHKKQEEDAQFIPPPALKRLKTDDNTGPFGTPDNNNGSDTSNGSGPGESKTTERKVPNNVTFNDDESKKVDDTTSPSTNASSKSPATEAADPAGTARSFEFDVDMFSLYFADMDVYNSDSAASKVIRNVILGENQLAKSAISKHLDETDEFDSPALRDEEVDKIFESLKQRFFHGLPTKSIDLVKLMITNSSVAAFIKRRVLKNKYEESMAAIKKGLKEIYGCTSETVAKMMLDNAKEIIHG